MMLQSVVGNLYLTWWANFCIIWLALNFCHFVWAWKATTSTIRRKLEFLQAMALRMCGPFCRKMPKVGMEMILNVSLIEIGRSYYRLRGTLESPLYVFHGFDHIKCEARF